MHNITVCKKTLRHTQTHICQGIPSRQLQGKTMLQSYMAHLRQWQCKWKRSIEDILVVQRHGMRAKAQLTLQNHNHRVLDLPL